MSRHRGTFQHWPQVWELWWRRKGLSAVNFACGLFDEAQPVEVNENCWRRHG